MGRTTLQSFVNIEQLVRYCRNHGLKKNAIVLKKMAMEENFVNNFFLITSFINYYRHLARLNHRSNAAKGPCSLFKLRGLLLPLLAACCDVQLQLSNPLLIPTACTMTLYLAFDPRT